MLAFILNTESIQSDAPPGTTLLDFIRYRQHLTGTKIGCREGDCGACTVLVGALQGSALEYRAMTSCLMPLANAQGKHIVTVEGINKPDGLTAVQQAMVEENGTQCGFCTVGFVMSMTGFCLAPAAPTQAAAISAIDGNICRCTGYKSIERAAERLTRLLANWSAQTALEFAVENEIVPPYFASIPARLSAIKAPEISGDKPAKPARFLGGGTDLYVQQAEHLLHADAVHLFDRTALQGIREKEGHIEIGGAATISDLLESPVMQGIFPRLYPHLKLVSSTPIRNMATIAGNLVNASPIGDLTIWLLALDASIVLRNGKTREIKLRDFYLGYKTLDKSADEALEKIRFKKPDAGFLFNFEKVCKRSYLDIASVNTAISLQLKNEVIVEAHVSAGGVGPIPLYLQKTSAFLVEKKIGNNPEDNDDLLREANDIMQAEISPISDVRGTADYKRLLLKQLLHAHFDEMLIKA